MNLLENPFYLLEASPRDDRRRIVELAEERSLSLDPTVCAQARADLTHPRNRLAAEVAWLPGLAPGEMSTALEIAHISTASLRAAQGLPALAKANLLAAALSELDVYSADGELVEDILQLATLLEESDARTVRALINQDRALSGFPEIQEASAVEEALAERRTHYRAAIKRALDVLPPTELVSVTTRVVTKATGEGSRHAPALIDDLVHTYEVEAQRFLETEGRNVELLVEAVLQGVVKERPPQFLKGLLSLLHQVVRNWDMVAQPIQLSALSRGLDHALSHQVAGPVRNLAVTLFNEHGMLEESQALTALLQSTFGEVPRVVEVTSGDAQALRDIAQQREAARKEWESNIYFEAKVGIEQPKPLLKLSASGIEWRGKHWPLESITRVRWGGVMDQGTNTPRFTIFFGSKDTQGEIHTLNEHTFSTLTSKLWLAVGQQLLLHLITELGKGARIQFGDAVVDDLGLSFSRRVRGAWSQLHLEASNGTLLIRHKEDSSAYAALPYLQVDNVHVLEVALRDLLATRAPVMMSDLLQNPSAHPKAGHAQ